jgi:nitrogen regulatory protein PII
MKLITAIIKPFKLEEVRDALTAIGRSRHHGDRSQGLWPPEGPYGNLPRRRIRRELPAQDQDRGGVASAQVDKTIDAITALQRPARSATARSSSSTSTMRCASAPAKPMTRRSDFAQTSSYQEYKQMTFKRPTSAGLAALAVGLFATTAA